jgi:hypothetical protein
VTISEKTCDERQSLLGFVRLSQVFPRTVTRIRTFVPDPPHCLLIAYSDPPRLASKSEKALRRNRESKEVPKRRKKMQKVQKVYKNAESVQKCRKRTRMQKMYKTAESAVLLGDVAALNIILTSRDQIGTSNHR